MDGIEDKRLTNILTTYGDASVESNWNFFTKVVVECNLKFFMKSACVQQFGHGDFETLDLKERAAFMGLNKRVIVLAQLMQEVDHSRGNSENTR